MMKETMASIRKFIFPILMLSLFIFFFIGGPKFYSPRSYQSFWNLGHILFFSLLPLLLFSHARIPNKFLVHCILALTLAAVLGAAVELLQSNFQDRRPDINDFYRDIIGAIVYISFFLPSRKNVPKPTLTLMQAGTLVLIGFQILPLLVAFHDEHLARKQFPLLSGWETRFEIQRWRTSKRLTIDETVKRTGTASMRVLFDTKKYSVAELLYFPRNWDGFSFFEFSIFNPSSEDIRIVCRIHDDSNETGMRYADRFKQPYQISKGWHTFRINLKSIRHHPKDRLINMQKIMSVSFLTIESPRQRIIYIDDVQLIK
jgi:VanZ family protein